MRRVVEVTRSGGTRVKRGAAAVARETAKEHAKPSAKESAKEPAKEANKAPAAAKETTRESVKDAPRRATSPSNGKGAKAVENLEPGLPSFSGQTATRVVREAAKVLEQELAAGLVAARRVEERFIDVQALRSRNPDEVMQRFRRDAHEVVDIVMDVLTVLVDTAANVTERSFSISGQRTVHTPEAPRPQRQIASKVPTLSMPAPIAPGETMQILISVENDAEKPTEPIVFKCSDLLSSEGGSIPGTSVDYAPNQMILAPRTTERVAIRVHVPIGTKPGTYCGMFQANNLEAVRAVLMVEVKEPA